MIFVDFFIATPMLLVPAGDASLEVLNFLLQVKTLLQIVVVEHLLLHG